MSFINNKPQQLDTSDIVSSVKLFALILTLIMIIAISSKGLAEEGFKYNPKGKRDPFVPLTSGTGTYASDAYEASAIEDIRLEGIVWDEARGSIAIINGEIVREGDAIGSMKVLKIRKDHVVFDVSGEEVMIDLNIE